MLKRFDRAANIVLVLGACLLLFLGVFLIDVAIHADHSTNRPKTAAEIRHECPLIVDETFRAQCFERARQADQRNAMPTVQ